MRNNSILVWISGLVLLLIPQRNEIPRILLVGLVLVTYAFLNRRQMAVINFGLSGLLYFITVLGYLNLQDLNSFQGTSLRFALPQESIHATVHIFLLASLLVVTFPKSKIASTPEVMIRTRVQGFSYTTLLVSVIPLLIGLCDFGIQGLLHRNTHLIGSQTSYLAHLTGPLSMLALGYLSAKGRNTKGVLKFFVLFIVILYAAYFLALSTRRIAIIPFAVLMLYFQHRKKFRYLIGIPLAVYSSLYLMNLVLVVRGELNQGLSFYIQALYAHNFLKIDLLSVFQNFIVSFQITGITAFILDGYPLRDFFIEINPLPGNFAGWYQILFRHSINSYTPTSTIGDLANYGQIVFTSSIVLVSLLGRRLSSMLLDAISNRDTLLGGLVVSGTIMTALNSLQYSLRSSMRLFYYTFFIFIFVLIFRKFFNKKSLL